MSSQQIRNIFKFSTGLAFVIISLFNCSCSISGDLLEGWDYIHPDPVNDEMGIYSILVLMMTDDEMEDCPPGITVQDLTLSVAVNSSVLQGNLKCYKFTSQSDGGYTITLIPGTGDADLFISEPDCIPDGTDYDPDPDATDYCRWVQDSEKIGLQEDSVVLPLAASQFITIGVFGWKESDYSLVVQ